MLRSAEEKRLARIWTEVLGLDPGGADADFFSLGGSSISAGQMLTRVQAETGVEMTFRDVFDAPRLGDLAAAIETRLAAAGVAAAAEPEAPTDRSPLVREYPLTDAQRRMWFLEQLYPDRATYRTITGLRLRGAVRTEALAQALAGLVTRHGALRTTFHDHDGVPSQRVEPPGPVPLPLVDLGDLAPGSRLEAVRHRAREEARRPVDLRSGPLLRATLLRLTGNDHVLLLMVHHLVFDAGSRVIALRELAELYRAAAARTPPCLAPLAIDYVDHVMWERSAQADGRRERSRAYWLDHLGAEPPVLEISHDRPRPVAPDFEGAREAIDLPQGTYPRLRDVAARERTTVASILLTAFAVLLHRYTESESMVVGLLVAGRGRRETRSLVGLLVNQLALRLDVASGDTFRTVLSRTSRTMSHGLDHQDEPLDDLVRAVRAGRPMGNSPLFQAAFNFKPHRDGTLDFGEGLTATEMPFDTGVAPFDITLEADVAGDEFTCYLDYARELFDPDRMRRMGRHYRNLLEGLLSGPDRPVGEISILDREERVEILAWGDNRRDFPVDRPVHQLLEEQVDAHPHATAIVSEAGSLGYGELNRRANRLAHHLRSLGVGPETIVGIVAERSAEAIVAIFAILKAGGAYLPLDADLPPERAVDILGDAGVRLVVATRPARWLSAPREVDVVRTDEAECARRIGGQSDANPEPLAGPDSLAYVIYTSGSTGRPKGVLVPHRCAVNMWLGFRDGVYRFAPDRPLRVSLDAALSFDASVEQILNLLGGHILHIAPEEVRVDAAAMVAYARRHALDVVDVVPSQMRLLLEAGLADPGHRRPTFLLVGGEAVDDATWRRLAESQGGEAFNLYGPTECTVNATIARITGSSERPHIGGPLGNVRAYVLDRRGGLVPAGVAGEIHLGGQSVARGYLNRPDLTAERFVPDPYSGQSGSRLYRTGDRARWVGGRLEFLGRGDHQVKLRGFRIELGEIEAALARHRDVGEAVVVLREDRPGDPRLVGYFTSPGAAPDGGALREHLRRTLPEFMVPSTLVRLDRLPLTAIGKVDRRALPIPQAGSAGGTSAPRGRPAPTAIGKRLYEIWGDLLARRDIEPDDDFFDIGGHSLLAVQLMAQIERAFGARLPPSVLLGAPTLARLTSILEERNPAPPSRFVPLNEAGTRSPIFLVTPFQGDALMFRDLARAMGRDRPAYSLQPPDVAGARFGSTIESAAAEMVRWIEGVQPVGPYHLAGYCIGGQIAFEVASQLQARGAEVAFLGLLDSVRHGTPIPGVDVGPHPGGARRFTGGTRRKAWNALLRATLEVCRRTGLPQPAYLRQDEALEILVARLHRPRRFSGSIVLFRSGSRPANNWQLEDLGWAGLATGGVRVVPIPGSHLEMLHPPEVKVLGERIAMEVGDSGPDRPISQ